MLHNNECKHDIKYIYMLSMAMLIVGIFSNTT